MAGLVGVDQSTVAKWLSNMKNHNAKDLRAKVTKKDRAAIADEAKTKPQSQVAADFGLSEGRVSQIVAKEREREERREAVGASVGTSQPTVNRDLATDTNVSVERIVGLDGKDRPAKKAHVARAWWALMVAKVRPPQYSVTASSRAVAQVSKWAPALDANRSPGLV